MRICRKCLEGKPSTKEFFYTAKDVPGGLKRICKKCEINSAMKRHKDKGPEYKAWVSMKSRCYNPNENGYEHYGGRGIKVCDRWLDDYQSFLDDMGKRPSLNHSIDRIDNDGNYEPSNCKWSEPYEQVRNQRAQGASGYRGIYWFATRNKWHVRIKTRRKRVHIGYYDVLEDAIEARKQAEIKYW